MTTDALIARAQAVLSAADGFTGRFFYQPAHTVDRGIGDCADYCAVDGALVYISHDCDCEDASLIDRDDVTEIGAIDKIIADPMAAILNDAPAVIRDLLALLADQARPRCPMTCPHGDRCTLDRGHADGHNHRCPCNEPDTDPGAADVLAWIRARIAECRAVEAKYMAPRVSRQTRRGAAAVTGPEGMPQAVIEAVAERQALTTVAAMLADRARGLTVGAALADPLVQAGTHVVEYNDEGAWRQLRSGKRESLSTRAFIQGFRGSPPERTMAWLAWMSTSVDNLDGAEVWTEEYALLCRLVPLADADRDPAERGPL